MRLSVCHQHGFVLPGDGHIRVYVYIYIYICICTYANIQNMVAHIYIGVDRCRNIHPYPFIYGTPPPPPCAD